MIRTIFLFALFGLMKASPSRCERAVVYKVTFRNLLTNRRFGDLIPEVGLNFSPLAGVSHTNRQSFLTARGFATRTVVEIAKTGNNMPFLRRARRLRRRGEGVKTVVGAPGGTPPGRKTDLMIEVDCEHSFITVLSMIAPSPDWIVQINNRNMLRPSGRFIRSMNGTLFAYDAGVDSGRDFTDPSDPSLDIPTKPRLNIAPLVEDETDRFEGRFVGRYFIKRMGRV